MVEIELDLDAEPLGLDVLLVKDVAAKGFDDEGYDDSEREVKDDAAVNSEVDVQSQTEVMSVKVVGLTVTKLVEVATCAVTAASVIVTVARQPFCCPLFWPAGEARDSDDIKHTKTRLRTVNILKARGVKNEWP
jgi:hypothetical protein